MPYRIQLRKVATIVMCAAAAMACEGGMRSPVEPSAVTESSAALNADGSNLKVSAPIALVPLFEATNISLTPTLAAIGSQGRNVAGNAGLSYRFQVSDNDFASLVANATGTVDASGIARYTVDPALSAAKRYVWRVRAELSDAAGPWSNWGAFSTAGAGGQVVATPGPSPNAGPRPADPPPGVQLPLPDMRGTLARFSDARDSCPRGLKYVNNPWQDRVIDAFRQIDSRWGYNGKPNRGASENNGVPVVAAGDEAAYHYSGGASQGSFSVHLVDMLIGHCGDAPSLTWRVFTGEEPGFWTGAGRF